MTGSSQPPRNSDARYAIPASPPLPVPLRVPERVVPRAIEKAPPKAGPSLSRSISRILSWTVIHLCDLPGTRRAASSSLLGLAPGGFCLAAASPRRRCALTAPFHPCRRRDSRATPSLRRLFSVALSRGFPRVGLPRPPLPWGVRTFLERRFSLRRPRLSDRQHQG